MRIYHASYVLTVAEERFLLQTRVLTRVFEMGESEVRALDGVDLQVTPNDFIVILGPSGAGKTTLLNLIGGIDRPTSGEVEVNGKVYVLSNHAKHRAEKREISLDEIKEALSNPKNCRRVRDTAKEEGAEVYGITGRNYIRVIVNLEHTVIITVLRVNKQYSKNKHKQRKNKRQLNNRKLYGNRAKK